MKFIHLSDLHLGKKVNGFSMHEDQQYILLQILNIADEQKPDAVIIAGDIYDKQVPPAESVSLFDWFFTKLKEKNIEIFMISGNHDSAERISFGANLLEKSGVHIAPVFRCAPKPFVAADDFGKLNIYMLPFVKLQNIRHCFENEQLETCNDAVKKLFESMNIDKSARNLLVCHQFITGAILGDSEELNVGGLDGIDCNIFNGFDYVALGHIHGPQSVCRKTVRYCGTPLKYSFSEANQTKSVTVVELHEKENVEILQIPLVPRHNLRNIKGSFEQITSKENYEKAPAHDYVHITLTDEEDILDAMAKLRAVYPNIMQLDYDNTRTRSNSTFEDAAETENKSPLELFEEFYEKQNNQPLNEIQREYTAAMIEKIWGNVE